jgi:plasmid stabilization system protein ParE
MPLRDFAQLQKDLEDIVTRLKQTRNPKARVRLLRELRRLLGEADLLIAEMD